MDTNSNIPPFIHKLDELGFGPQGKHSRKEWRAECLVNLLAGREAFRAWQDGWSHLIQADLPEKSFGFTLYNSDGSEKKSIHPLSKPYSFDFVACELNVGLFEFTMYPQPFVFQQTAMFAGATFFGYAFFEDITFAKGAYFFDVIFTQGATFNNTNFEQFANFSNTRFELNASFFKTTFNGPSFRCATFIEIANFEESKFNGFTDFRNTTFCKDVNFSKNEFNSEIRFGSTSFEGNSNFKKTQFKDQCRFENEQDETTKEWLKETLFSKAVNFENAQIDNVGHFERVKFNGETPNFLGVDNAKTLLVFSGDEYFNKEDTTEVAVKRIGQLKRLADEQGQTDQALMFNAFELNAKRAQAKLKIKSIPKLKKLGNSDFWFANATYLYDKFSDYGRSFTRPLLAYLALMLVTWVIAIGHGLWASMDACEREGWNVYEQLYRDQVSCPVVATAGEQKIPLTVPRAAFEYTAYRASGVLDFVDADKQTIAVANRLFNQPIEPMWMRIWGVLKAIASAALLFLAALGLRNKYRIK